MSRFQFEIFRKPPYFLIPLQGVVAITTIYITLGMYFEATVPLFLTALSCFLTSIFVTIPFALGVQQKFVHRYSFGLLSWNAVDFVYSSFLGFYCGKCVVISLRRALWARDGFQDSYVQCIVFFGLLTISYGVSLVYIVRKELKILTNEEKNKYGYGRLRDCIASNKKVPWI